MSFDRNIGQYLVSAFAENKASHAYIVCGDKQFLPQLLKECAIVAICATHSGTDNCEACRKAHDGVHQDIITLPADASKRLTVADVSYLIDESSKRPVDNGDRRVFIINAANSVQGIGADVWQNKLLKTLEEPMDGVYIFIGVVDAEALLPTVRSRCQVLHRSVLTTAEVNAALQRSGFDKRTCQIVASMCGGSIEGGLAIINNSALFKAYERAIDACVNMTSTKNAVKYVGQMVADKTYFVDMLAFWERLFAESIYYRLSPELCELSELADVVSELCRSYTLQAANACIELLNEAKRRIDDGGNLQIVADNLASNILEVKYRCRL